MGNLTLFIRQKAIVWILIFGGLLLSTIPTFAEEVCKFAYKGKPEQYNNDTMIVPDEMVAMSEYLYVHDGDDLANDTLYQPSIMFVIDYSGSMTGATGNDPENARILVPSALLDTLLEKCPLAEVGISLWAGRLKFERADDPYKAECPGEPGGYCPLFQLNKTYPPDNKTGYEILKWYFEMGGGDYLAYFQGSVFLNGTNITTGVNASKHAFSNTQRVKAAHFNIFFSDGEPGQPQPDPFVFVEGSDVATTFTIFFGAPSAPQCLLDFTDNVKANNYSTNNPKSDIWSIENVGQDTLMNFIMKNVINNILLEEYDIPFEMNVNGGTIINNWNNDSTGFLFPELFPLTGQNTDFEFIIEYHKRRIYVDQQTGQIDTIDTDTTHNIAFDVEIDPNQGPLDSMWDVKCWDRELGFYYNGAQVTTVDETMTPLELRFAFTPGDAQYSYTKASIEVGNTSTNGSDIETVTLTKNGNTFTGTFPLAVIDDAVTPAQNDGTLQHYAVDNLTAVFRNDEDPKLPLDTLKIQIPFDFGGTINVSKAYYFDNDAQGYIDSIYVEATTDIAGDLTDTHITEMVNKALTLPSFRGFTVNSSGVATGGFYVKVTEDNNHDPATYVTNDDKIEVASVVLNTGGQVQAATVDIVDKVAPIIHWQERAAILTDYQMSGRSDTLIVKFSETVRSTSADEPFYFFDVVGGSNYTVTLMTAGLPDPDRMLFEVVSVSGTMEDGDSLWIHETDRICDTVGNYQNNTNNIKRRLYIDKVNGTVVFDCAYYFDNAGDGFVDSIYVKSTTDIEGGYTEVMVDEVVDKALTLPVFRNFTINNSGLTSGGFYLDVTESTTNPTTYVTSDDKLEIKQTTLSNGGNVPAKSITLYDKVAPLIHWDAKSALAVVHQDESVTDTLFVTFSEPVKNVSASMPFRFLSIQNATAYTATLSALDQPSNDKMAFAVQSLSGIDKMRDGDSIWIYEGDRVGDECKDESGNTVTNYQNNTKNTKRRLYVETRLLPFTLIPVAVSPLSISGIDKSDKYIIPDKYIHLLEEQGVFNDLKLQKNDNGKYVGMIINVVPDHHENVFESFELKGNVTILDPVGNKLIEKIKMGWDDEKKRLIFVWNVKNINGRYVGPGMYLSLIEIEETTEGLENSGLKAMKKLMIGVK